jgi:hypothetical protein
MEIPYLPLDAIKREVCYPENRLRVDPELPNQIPALRNHLYSLSKASFSQLLEDLNTPGEKRTWPFSGTIGDPANCVSTLNPEFSDNAFEAALSSFGYLYNHNLIPENANVIDLGSYDGTFLLTLAAIFPDLNTYGIELQPFAIDIYQRILENLFNLPQNGHKNPVSQARVDNVKKLLSNIDIETKLPKVIVGNLFEDYVEKNSSRYSVSWDFMDIDIEKRPKVNEEGALPVVNRQYTLAEYTQAYTNPNERMGMSLADFDIVYLYQFDEEIVPILELIPTACKAGSFVVINNQPVCRSGIPLPKGLRPLVNISNQCLICEVVDAA